MKIEYIKKRFSEPIQKILNLAEEIITDYESQGYNLTLRQLYYQFVSRDIIPNNLRSYKNLGEAINNGRLGGVLSWDAITDRTRERGGRTHWESPQEIINASARGYHIDYWLGQLQRVEVWVEKDALVDIVENACFPYDVGFLSCRGYVSQSEMHKAAMRFVDYYKDHNATTVILHCGDHDPSGIDMTRDIRERLALFCEHHGAEPPEVVRIALNMDQVKMYNPPPNPAKITDSRSDSYIKRFGKKSWELDALEPKVLTKLIQKHIDTYIDKGEFVERAEIEKKQIAVLNKVAEDLGGL